MRVVRRLDREGKRNLSYRGWISPGWKLDAALKTNSMNRWTCRPFPRNHTLSSPVCCKHLSMGQIWLRMVVYHKLFMLSFPVCLIFWMWCIPNFLPSSSVASQSISTHPHQPLLHAWPQESFTVLWPLLFSSFLQAPEALKNIDPGQYCQWNDRHLQTCRKHTSI